MEFDWRFFFTALGLAFMLEGLPYFLMAERIPELLRSLAEKPPAMLRFMGGGAILLGLTIIFVIRAF